LNFKQVIGLLAIVLGIALIIFVIYGKRQLNEGKEQIASGKKKVNQTQQIFSFTPLTKQVGQGLTGGAEKKIAAGELTIDQYETMFMWCQLGGVALIVLGACLVLFCRNPHRR
jgi:hypothetical protein